MLFHRSEGTHELVVLATLALILNSLLKPAEASLKVTVAIPELVKIHDGFWLNCSHDSPHRLASLTTNSQDPKNVEQQPNFNSPTANQFQQIYSIKWYKDEEEFYSFLPNGDPKVSHYEMAGVKADVSILVRISLVCRLVARGRDDDLSMGPLSCSSMSISCECNCAAIRVFSCV